MNTPVFIVALIFLATGTYFIRLAGAVVGSRAQGEGSGIIQLWLDRAAVLLLLGIAMIQMSFDGTEPAGLARIIGVLSGVAVLLLRLPLLVAVALAMIVTAALRTLGIA